MSVLTKKSRDNLPDSDFACPGKRKLPINDEHHTKLAWSMVDRTEGLTPEEKATAKRRIMDRAKELGVDTTDWHKVKAMALDAMALNISNDDDHPNKMPFSGVLTKVGEPSDAPPGGSGGRRVMITVEAAERAIPSLLGMAVDFTPVFDGHDPQAKVGIITSAEVIGNEIHITGFVYAADFPEVAASIKALKSALGFSFEAQRITVADPGAEILEIVDLAFTGAAILRKDKAAYQTTSLAASADEMEIHMTPDELKAMLAEAVAPLADRLAKIEAEAKEKIEANASTISKVEPHAANLESCAAGMEAAGIGLAPNGGHVETLRRMAGSMRAEAANGKIPHIWRDHDYPYSAAAEHQDDNMDPKLITDAVDAAMKPILDKLAAAETKIADLQASARIESPAPERKTVAPAISKLLAKAGIDLPEGEDKLSIAKVDDAMSKANLSMTQRLQLKNELSRAGQL